MNTIDTHCEEMVRFAEEKIGQKATSAQRLTGGGNSRVCAITFADGSRLVAKSYAGPTQDGADRMKVETTALAFLAHRGEGAIPRLVVADRDRNVTLMEWIDGKKIETPNDSDIDRFVSFLLRLDGMREDEAASALPFAAEAMRAPVSLFDQIERRLERFDAIGDATPRIDALRSFLDGPFREESLRLRRATEEATRQKGIDFTTPFDRRQLTLSPSDTGFHNALKRPDGSLVFLDFEYFGWDDPAKMIADVLHHPAMRLTRAQKRNVAQRLISALSPSRPDLAWRAATFSPVIGLKWITIVLNEFIRSDRDRRHFASGTDAGTDVTALLDRQLASAQTMLRHLPETEEGLWDILNL